jgi:hypothetical protein
MKNSTKGKNVNVSMGSGKRFAIWKNRVTIGKAFTEKNYKKSAQRYREFFRGNHYPQIAEAEDRIVINYAYAIIKSMIPQIYFQDPWFYLTAETRKDANARQLAEYVLNQSWRKIGAKRTMRRIILDALVYSIGVGKLGYYTDVVKPQNLETNKEYSYLINDEYPYFLKQNTLEMIFDPEAEHFDDMRWLGARYFVPFEELRSSSMDYKGIDGLGESNYSLDREYSEYVKPSSSEEKDDLKRVELWEMHDLVENEVLTICMDADDFLRVKENPYGFNNYKILYFNEVPDKLIPISEVANLEKINKEYDDTRSQLMYHRRKAQRKILFEQGTFASSEERQKFLNSVDMAPVEVIDGAISGKRIQMFDASMVQPELYNYCDLSLFDMNNVSRSGFNQRAVESPTEKTATESSIIEKNASLGNAERLDYVADYCEDAARDLLGVLQKFATKKQEFYIDKLDAWAEWKNTDIAGNFAVRIDMGSMGKRNTGEDRARAVELFNMLAGLTEPDPQSGAEKLIVNRRILATKVMEAYGLSEQEISEVLQDKEPKKELVTPEQARAQEQRARTAQANQQIMPPELAMALAGGMGPMGGMGGM